MGAEVASGRTPQMALVGDAQNVVIARMAYDIQLNTLLGARSPEESRVKNIGKRAVALVATPFFFARYASDVQHFTNTAEAVLGAKRSYFEVTHDMEHYEDPRVQLGLKLNFADDTPQTTPLRLAHAVVGDTATLQLGRNEETHLPQLEETN